MAGLVVTADADVEWVSVFSSSVNLTLSTVGYASLPPDEARSVLKNQGQCVKNALNPILPEGLHRPECSVGRRVQTARDRHVLRSVLDGDPPGNARRPKILESASPTRTAIARTRASTQAAARSVTPRRCSPPPRSPPLIHPPR